MARSMHGLLPAQDARRAGSYRVDPYKRLMAAVLQTVVDDFRGSAYRRARGYETPICRRSVRTATAYVASTDRTWPFSFENLCEALDVDVNDMRSACNYAMVCHDDDSASSG